MHEKHEGGNRDDGGGDPQAKMLYDREFTCCCIKLLLFTSTSMNTSTRANKIRSAPEKGRPNADQREIGVRIIAAPRTSRAYRASKIPVHVLKRLFRPDSKPSASNTVYAVRAAGWKGWKQ